MNVTVKLYALLSKYLPRDTMDQTVKVDIAGGASPHAVLARFNVPPEKCHLVLVNGHYIQPGERDIYKLKDNDALAVWPPIAGGAS